MMTNVHNKKICCILWISSFILVSLIILFFGWNIFNTGISDFNCNVEVESCGIDNDLCSLSRYLYNTECYCLSKKEDNCDNFILNRGKYISKVTCQSDHFKCCRSTLSRYQTCVESGYKVCVTSLMNESCSSYGGRILYEKDGTKIIYPFTKLCIKGLKDISDVSMSTNIIDINTKNQIEKIISDDFSVCKNIQNLPAGKFDDICLNGKLKGGILRYNISCDYDKGSSEIISVSDTYVYISTLFLPFLLFMSFFVCCIVYFLAKEEDPYEPIPDSRN